MLEQFEHMVNMWTEAYPSGEDYEDYVRKGDVVWRKPTNPCEDQAMDRGFGVDLGKAPRCVIFRETHGRIRPRIHSHSRGWDVVRNGDFDLNGKSVIPRSVLLSRLPKNWDGFMEMRPEEEGESFLSDQPEEFDRGDLDLVNVRGGWESVSIGEF